MIFAILLFFLIFPYATSLSFNFTSLGFDPSNHEIYYEGDATPKDSVIQLTKGQPNSTGRATFAEPMHLWDKDSGSLADFTTHFTFSIDAQHIDPYGDGISFFLASIHFRIPGVPEGGGLGLATGDLKMNSTELFVAVEYDTFHNMWDPDGDHVGIDISSLMSSKSEKWYSSVMNGKTADSTIIYNSRSKNLSVFFTGFIDNITIHQELHYEVDLRDYLPEWVTIGFSSATGANFELHTIHSWYFSSDIQNTITPSPPPPVMPNPYPGQNDKKTTSDKSMKGLEWGIIAGASVLVVGLGALIYLIWPSVTNICAIEREAFRGGARNLIMGVPGLIV